jgi:PleD family two-component response regulator
MPNTSKTILAVVDDLFFNVKISDAAKRAGLQTVFFKSEKEVVEAAKADPPLMIIIDLNANSVKPVALVEKLRAEADLKRVSVIGFVSHIQGELKQKAQDAGCNMVMARSAFSSNLPQILKRHSGAV